MSFAPIEALEPLDPVAGGQGGYHVYLAIRTKNLRQTSAVTLTGYVPDLDATVGPFSFNAEFPESPEVGACELSGIRFRLDTVTGDVADLLGLAVEVTAQVADEDGATNQDVKLISISNHIQY
jgi:hypothetical protein